MNRGSFDSTFYALLAGDLKGYLDHEILTGFAVSSLAFFVLLLITRGAQYLFGRTLERWVPSLLYDSLVGVGKKLIISTPEFVKF